MSLLCTTIEAAALASVTGGKSPGDNAERLKLQKQLQDRAQMSSLMRDIVNMRHQTAKSIIGNIR